MILYATSYKLYGPGGRGGVKIGPIEMRVLIILLVGYKKTMHPDHFLRQICKHAELHTTIQTQLKLDHATIDIPRILKEKWYSQTTLLMIQRPLYTRLSNHGHNVSLNTIHPHAAPAEVTLLSCVHALYHKN